MSKKNLTSNSSVDHFRFNTAFNYDHTDPTLFNDSSDVLITVPDDSLTIPEILHRHVHGGWTPDYADGTYTGDFSDGFDDVDPIDQYGFDLADASDLQSSLRPSLDSAKAIMSRSRRTPSPDQSQEIIQRGDLDFSESKGETVKASASAPEA